MTLSPITTETPHTETPGVPQTVGVLGGGRMGAGIAHAFLVSGAAVTVVERDAAAAAAALDRVTATLSKAIEKNAVAEDLESLLGRVAGCTDAAAFGNAGRGVGAGAGAVKTRPRRGRPAAPGGSARRRAVER